MTFKEIIVKWNKGVDFGSRQKLADEIKYTKGAVSEWVRGTSAPGEEIITQLSKVLKVPIADIKACFPKRYPPSGTREGGAEYTAQSKEHRGDVTGPEVQVNFAEVIGIVSAETFKEPMEDSVRLDVIDYLYKRKSGRRTYALRISGSCMEPKASDGDYAVIEETSDVPDGTLAVICWDGECTLKRVYHRSDHLELRPDNPNYKVLRPKLKDCRIIGIVKSFIRKP